MMKKFHAAAILTVSALALFFLAGPREDLDSMAISADEGERLRKLAESTTAISTSENSAEAQDETRWTPAELDRIAHETFEKGDICAYFLTSAAVPSRLQDEWDRKIDELTLTSGANPVGEDESVREAAIALVLPDRSWLQPGSGSDSRRMRFLQALALSGLLSGFETGKDANLHRAIEIFEQLESEEPNNSAFRYFKIGALLASERNAQQVSEELLALFQTDDFNSLLQPVHRAIFQAGLRNPIAFLAGIRMRAALPTPDYSPTLRAIREAVDFDDDQFARGAFKFGTLLKSSRLLVVNDLGGVDWLPIEFAIGESITRKSWDKVNPDDPLPRDRGLAYREYLDRFQDVTLSRIEKAVEKLARGAPTQCNPQLFNELFESAKSEAFQRTRAR